MKSLLPLVERYVSRASPMLILIGSLVGLGLIAWLDVATGSEVSLSLLYLAPISVVAWRTNRAGAVAAAIAGATTWFLADAADGFTYAHPLIPLWNALVRLGFFTIVGLLLVTLRRTLQRERAAGRTDALTGLLNRRAFEELASRELERAQRGGSAITFAFVDLDGFKAINDQLGHAAGDEVLRTVGRVMNGALRTIDVKARLGGDEFGLVLPDTERVAAEHAIERLSLGLVQSGVACSMGAVVFEEAPGDVLGALEAVDAVMYAVKADPTRRLDVRVVGRSARAA